MDYQAHSEAFERAKLAREALVNCNLCPRQCGVDRTAGEKGYCGLDDTVRCFRDVLLCNEESELVPSHQIYFAGCNIRCQFCAVAEWNEQPSAAKEIDFDDMAKKVARYRKEGAKTLNLLGGEPTVNLQGILELLGRVDCQIRVVWNSNMYYNEIVDKLMTGLIDVYLADFKCGNDSCAKKLLGADNYVDIVKQNILKALKHADVIVRHLILPGHSQCCLKPILKWLAEEVPDVKLSFWGDYMPPAQLTAAPTEYLTQKDMQTAVDLAESMGLRLVK